MTLASVVRSATEGDLAGIDRIYDHYVRTWLLDHAGGRHRAFVAVDDGRVVGFAGSSRYRPRAAYNTTVETTVYVDPGFVGRGVGGSLYRTLFEAIEGEDVHRALAGIALPNDASIALHERFGFRRVAHFSEQGRKFGRYWDVDWYERPIAD